MKYIYVDIIFISCNSFRSTLSSLSSASIKHSTPTYPAAVPRWVSKLDETAGSVENLRDATAASRDMRDLSLDTVMAAWN